ncbi:methyl-accepting chemotaxis protein [Selenomonas felix]|uniref:methyl-accepting chemotaxis protein n=1 Tax=Selenomonas felix TaxID=1944634 RepID=UPI00148370EF|nr:methyl-accepting chemotaxis protein [Selenomonas felix]
MKNLYELSGIKGEDVFKSTAEHPFTIRKDSSSMYAPISFDGVTAQWGIGSATNYDVFTAVARHMIYILVAVGIIGILLLLAALISFVTKRISTPMSDLQGVVENFARLDLRADNPAYVRARGYLGREDEIGAMTGDLAELANNLRATMGKINASSESVAATSEELRRRERRRRRIALRRSRRRSRTSLRARRVRRRIRRRPPIISVKCCASSRRRSISSMSSTRRHRRSVTARRRARRS